MTNNKILKNVLKEIQILISMLTGQKTSKCQGKCSKAVSKPKPTIKVGGVKLNEKKKVVNVKCIKFVNQNAIKLNGRTIKPSQVKVNGNRATIPTAWKAYKEGKYKTIEFFA